MGRTEMDAQGTKLENAENDLNHLMDEVSRAMHKAQEAVVRITSKGSGRPDRETSDGFAALVALDCSAVGPHSPPFSALIPLQHFLFERRDGAVRRKRCRHD